MSIKLLKYVLYVSLFSIIASSCTKKSQVNDQIKNVAPKASASAIYPDSLNKIKFSGFTWTSIEKLEPESLDDINVYKKECVFVDSIGMLHIKLKKIGDSWYGARLVCDSIFDYGDYAFNIVSPLNKLDTNVVLTVSTVNAKQYVVKGMTESGVRFTYGSDPDVKSNIEYFMYSTSRKFAGVKRNYVKTEDISASNAVMIGVYPNLIYYKIFKGMTLNESNMINVFNLTPKNKLNANSEIDELVYAKPYYKMKPQITLGFYDITGQYPNTDIEIVINKFYYYPSLNNTLASK